MYVLLKLLHKKLEYCWELSYIVTKLQTLLSYHNWVSKWIKSTEGQQSSRVAKAQKRSKEIEGGNESRVEDIAAVSASLLPFGGSTNANKRN